MLSSAVVETGSSDANPSSFAELALPHLKVLYTVALRLTRNPTDAEDLVQDTYLKAFRFADHFEQGTSVRAWLLTILRRTYLNARRHAARNPVRIDSDIVEQSHGCADLGGDPERRAMAACDVDRVRTALGALPSAFRETVWLRDLLDLSYQETAERLGVPVGTVMSRLSRGRRMLHDHLTRELGEGCQARPSRLPSLAPQG